MPGLNISKVQAKKIGSRSRSEREAFLFSLLNKDFKIRSSNKFSDKQKESFYLELNAMISAGLDIKVALEIIEKEQKSEKSRNIITSIKERLISGNSLSEAIRKTGCFTPHEYFTIEIGEESGMLIEVMGQLAVYFDRKVKQKRQFMNAMSYPMVILFTSVGAVSFMLYFIVPMFSDIFKRFGGQLPKLTVMVISMSSFVSSNLIYFLIFIVSGIIFYKIYHKHIFFKKISSKIISRIPLFGKIYSGLYLARFCSSMSLLSSARVPLIRSIQLVKAMIGYYPIVDALDGIEIDIINGKTLNESMSRFPVFSYKMVSLVKVGEEVNKLETFFDKLSKTYSEEVEQKTSVLSAFMEPVMIVFLGIAIGFILVAMYLPMFQLSTQIGG